MTQDMVKSLPDDVLAKVKGWAIDEEAARTEKRRQDTIAKIRELAGAVGVSVTFNGRRGRPPKAKADTTAGKAAAR